MRSIVSAFVLMFVALPALAQQCLTTAPPKGAIVLVDGSDTSAWKAQDGGSCPWPAEDGVMTVKGANIMTKREFGDIQLHIEFQIPPRTKASHRGHGNSGVYLHGDYELQVIDSYGKPPHSRSSCGCIYREAAPMVDASLPAGEWQSFDVLFRAPQYDNNGKLLKKARMTVLHNGIWIHDNVEVNATPGGLTDNFKNTGPIWLQVHGYPVRYRNIWVRELAGNDASDRKETKDKK
jgi:hypothetical protein